VTSIPDDWDATVRSVAWAADSRSLLVTARVGLDEPLFQISLDGRNVIRLTEEGRVANVISLPQGGAVISLDTLLQPADLYRVSAGSQLARLTAINEDRLREIEVPHLERFEFKASKRAIASAWMIAPPARQGRLPTVLLIHDGQEAEPANSWSRHWNPWLFSAPGYVVTGVDIHDQGKRSDRDRLALDDLRRGLAAAALRFPAVDPENICIAGDGAYGGFLAYRIAGEWSRQARCLIVNGGVVDAASISYQTDEPWIHDWHVLSTSGQTSPWNPLHSSVRGERRC
jgi:dipeptidyl aminopeptidase/acylaminoacyl peptidase